MRRLLLGDVGTGKTAVALAAAAQCVAAGKQVAILAPTMMRRIWLLPEDVKARYDVTSLRFVVHTAAPCPDWLKQAWIDWLGPKKI